MLAQTPVWLQLILVGVAWAILIKPCLWIQTKYIPDEDNGQERGADE